MIRILTRTLFVLSLLVSGFACTGPEESPPRAGLLVMAHGGDRAWNEAVEAAVGPLTSVAPTEIAYGMADRDSLQKAVQKLEAKGVDRIAVVRLFVSGDSFLEQTQYFLGLIPEPPPVFLLHEHGGDMADAFASRNPMHAPRFVSSREHPIPPIQTQADILLSASGLYDSQDIGRIVVERVQALSRNPSRESVLILAHGEGEDRLNQKWLQQLDSLMAAIAQVGTFRSVRVETLREDWAEKRELAEQRIRQFVEQGHQDSGEVLVIPFRVFGFGPYASVLEGLTYRADGLGLLPHRNVTQWLSSQASGLFQERDWPEPFSGSGTDPNPAQGTP